MYVIITIRSFHFVCTPSFEFVCLSTANADDLCYPLFDVKNGNYNRMNITLRTAMHAITDLTFSINFFGWRLLLFRRFAFAQPLNVFQFFAMQDMLLEQRKLLQKEKCIDGASCIDWNQKIHIELVSLAQQMKSMYWRYFLRLSFTSFESRWIIVRWKSNIRWWKCDTNERRLSDYEGGLSDQNDRR